jgi:hypothetical protein
VRFSPAKFIQLICGGFGGKSVENKLPHLTSIARPAACITRNALKLIWHVAARVIKFDGALRVPSIELMRAASRTVSRACTRRSGLLYEYVFMGIQRNEIQTCKLHAAILPRRTKEE